MSYTFLAIGLRWRRKTWNMNSGSVAKGSCGKSGSYGNPSCDVVGDDMSTRSGDAAFAPESRRSDFVPDFTVRGRSVIVTPASTIGTHPPRAGGPLLRLRRPSGQTSRCEPSAKSSLARTTRSARRSPDRPGTNVDTFRGLWPGPRRSPATFPAFESRCETAGLRDCQDPLPDRLARTYRSPRPRCTRTSRASWRDRSRRGRTKGEKGEAAHPAVGRRTSFARRSLRWGNVRKDFRSSAPVRGVANREK